MCLKDDYTRQDRGLAVELDILDCRLEKDFYGLRNRTNSSTLKGLPVQGLVEIEAILQIFISA